MSSANASIQQPRVVADPVAPAKSAACYHCGLPVPASGRYRAAGLDASRSFCCPGCEAVSRSITELGLEDYYRLRDAAPPPVADTAPDPAAYDEPTIQKRYVTRTGDGIAEARLLVEGMRCAACAWLIEQSLLRLQGVESVVVQFALRRVTVRWRDRSLEPSALVAAIARIGYAAWPYEEGRTMLIEAGERRRLMRRLWVAGLAMMQVMMYAVPAYIARDGEVSADAESLMRWAGLVLTLPVLVYSAAPFFKGAWRDLRVRTLGMDVPIAFGVAVAFAASAWSTVTGAGAVYFDSVAMFVFLLLGARYLEVLALGNAGRALASLGRIVPERAHRLAGSGLETAETVLASTLGAGDRVLVRPGESVPADGELDSDAGTFSEAWMSGESRPVTRRRGENVFCGSVNAGSATVVRVTRVGGDTTVSNILRLIERSLAGKPRWVASSERAVPVFVGAILITALIAAAAWLAIDPSRALPIAVAVLIVTCPCALALATPVAMSVATGALARSNVAVTRAGAIEALAGVTDVVLDKTGTLTGGEPALVDIVPFTGYTSDGALHTASALAAASSHPLDLALRRAAKNLTLPGASVPVSVPGEGIEAIVNGSLCRLGRMRFAAALTGDPAPDAKSLTADSTAWLASEAGWIAAFHFRDALRADAQEAVASLKRLGVKVHMLSGDDDAIVRATASTLEIADAHSRATPEDKCAFVRTLQAAGARVAMVGDGINDAPVLAQADVSIAMHSGADLAKVRADAVLLSDAPSDVAAAIRIARKARAVIRQNLGWALGYNLVVIPLAVTGQLSPLIAGAGMSLSSLLVVVNSLRAR